MEVFNLEVLKNASKCCKNFIFFNKFYFCFKNVAKNLKFSIKNQKIFENFTFLITLKPWISLVISNPFSKFFNAFSLRWVPLCMNETWKLKSPFMNRMKVWKSFDAFQSLHPFWIWISHRVKSARKCFFLLALQKRTL